MTAKTIPSYVEVDTQHCGLIRPRKGYYLSDVYGRYSDAKAAAWEWCENLCAELDGYYYCITSYNQFAFVVQFEFDNPEDGRPMVCRITPSRTYAMYLDMHHIDTARDAWREYATIYVDTTARPKSCDVYEGVHVMWVGCVAYIIAYDEVYRVADAWTATRKLRKLVKLRRIGRYDDSDEARLAAVVDAAGLVYDSAR